MDFFVVDGWFGGDTGGWIVIQWIVGMVGWWWMGGFFEWMGGFEDTRVGG